MAKIVDWDGHIGRRLKLRDLHVFFTVVQHGSLSKAASHLKVSHPAVSQLIADLEHALGTKLLDRSSRGVSPTIYVRALLDRGRAAFDELKQAIRDIEFLSDPATGEIKIGCPDGIRLTSGGDCSTSGASRMECRACIRWVAPKYARCAGCCARNRNRDTSFSPSEARR